MKGLIFWFLDKILYVSMVLLIIISESFNEFEKCVLILIIGALISLDNIKEIIKIPSKEC